MEDNTPQSQAILVVGPHRSGTSAVARVLNLLGVDLGGEMLPPKFDNRHGYWEHQRIFQLHESLLSEAGSYWHDYLPMPAGWRERTGVEDLRQELRRFLDEEFGEVALWGVKDPRLCHLLPLWLDILEELSVEPLFVVVVRNPLEVVGSLERRDRFSRSKCILLYVAEILTTLEHTQGRRRAFVSYERLLEDWARVTADAARQLGIEWPCEPAARAEEIDAFLKPGERHHRSDVAELRDDSALPGWCADLYQALDDSSAGRGGDLDGAFGRAHDAYRTALALFQREVEELRREQVRLERRAERVEGELTKVQRQLTTILSSRMYRCTRPFRHAWYRLARLRE